MDFINTMFKRLTATERTSEAVEDSKIILDYTTPSIYLDNDTTRVDLIPVVDDLATAIAITEDHIPCGTKVAKELAQSLNGYQITTGELLNTTLSLGWEIYTITFNEELNNSPSFCSFVINKPDTGGAVRLVYAPQWTDATNTQATCAIYNADSTTMVVDIKVFAVCKA